jgi:leucyl aminopeptidase
VAGPLTPFGFGSGIADIQDVGGGKGGGAIVTAMFLKGFTSDTQWIHLYIAAVAWQDDVKPWNTNAAKGATMRTLLDLAIKFGSNRSSTKYIAIE